MPFPEPMLRELDKEVQGYNPRTGEAESGESLGISGWLL